MSFDIPEENPFARPPFAMRGDADRNTLHTAKSEALDAWEFTELGFANIFSKLVSPRASGYAARRAYGCVVAGAVRRQMIETAAEVFFRNFPNDDAHEALPKLMNLYSAASGRRNDFAHGMVGGDMVDGRFWHFLGPNTWTSKTRRIDLSIDYRYSSDQINEIQQKFHWLAGLAFKFFDALDHAYWSAPEKARQPY